MRTLLVMIGVLAAAPLFADERTWSIATGVITTRAELVAVRGDFVYLKIGDKVEEYPLARLSAADQRYIASLSLAPILPGPGDDFVEKPIPSEDRQPPITPPTPGVAPMLSGRAADTSVPKGPVLVPPVTEEAIPLPPGAAANATNATTPRAGTQPRTTRSSNYNNTAVPSGLSNQTSYRGTNAQGLNTLNNGGNNSNYRRVTPTQQQQLPSQSQLRRTTSQQNQNQNDAGLLGIRGRRRGR